MRAPAGATISQHRGVGRRTRAPGYDARMSEQTVLVVDDEEAIAEAVRARLESEGYRVARRRRRARRPSSRTPSTAPTSSCST